MRKKILGSPKIAADAAHGRHAAVSTLLGPRDGATARPSTTHDVRTTRKVYLSASFPSIGVHAADGETSDISSLRMMRGSTPGTRALKLSYRRSRCEGRSEELSSAGWPAVGLLPATHLIEVTPG